MAHNKQYESTVSNLLNKYVLIPDFTDFTNILDMMIGKSVR